MEIRSRILVASKAATVHLIVSLVIAAAAALVVLFVWYPHPYDLLSGGRKLFLVLVGVDVVCGPLLTLISYSPVKQRREIIVDFLVIASIQLAALVYGIHTAYQARPLFLVHEIDRFQVITHHDYQGANVALAIENLPSNLQPKVFRGPVTVGIRPPNDREERHQVLLDAITGGRDYSQRPEFYVAYSEEYQKAVVNRARSLKTFLDRYPSLGESAERQLASSGTTVEEARVLPVLHKEEWAAILSRSGGIVGFLPGDAFSLPTEK